MPLFDYRCDGCATRFEALLDRAGDGAPPCPSCGDVRVTRLLSTFSVLGAAPERPPGACGTNDCACRRHADC